MNKEEILTSSYFVREPVDNICKEIIESNSSRIILNGGRGVGKTTILKNLENKTIGTKDLTIYMLFDSEVNFALEPTPIFTKELFEYYYEIIFCQKILNYIKDNYILTYNKYFKNYQKIINDLNNELNRYISNVYYQEVSLTKSLKTGELASILITKLSEYLKVDSINLAIDRFDWTNGKSIYIQKLLNKYFLLFNKVIITTDDKFISPNSNYHLITPTYSHDLNIIKSIIERRIEHIKENNPYFYSGFLTDEIYEYLITKTNGDISLMFTCITSLNNYFWLTKKLSIDNIKDLTNKEINCLKKVRKVSISPKLYL